MLNAIDYTKPLILEFERKANIERRDAMSAYMKNKFVFYGIMTTERRAILKEFITQSKPLSWTEVKDVAQEIWQNPEREMHYCAIELFEHYKKNIDEGFIIIIEKLIKENSWWDTVDAINSKLVDYYFKKFPNKIYSTTTHWNNSNNIWLIRVSIIFQLKWKTKIDIKILEQNILPHTKSKEFFIQKAIGWALREYSKTNHSWVLEFVRNNSLPSLSKKEALRLI